MTALAGGWLDAARPLVAVAVLGAVVGLGIAAQALGPASDPVAGPGPSWEDCASACAYGVSRYRRDVGECECQLAPVPR